MIRRPPRSTLDRSSAASDVYKRQDVHCKSADIEGRITGDIEVSEVLTLKSSSIVEGNIYTAKIVIENGAHFDGICLSLIHISEPTRPY